MRVTRTIQSTVIRLVAEVTCAERTAISPQTSIGRDLGADSLDALEIAAALEHAFGIEIPDECLAGLDTVSGIVERIAALLRTPPATRRLPAQG